MEYHWTWQEIAAFKQGYGALVCLCALGLSVLYFMLVWFFRGRDPKKGKIDYKYAPPKGISPAAASYLDRMGSTSKRHAMLCSVISLCVKKRMAIVRQNGSVLFRKLSDEQADLSEDEKVLMMLLFVGSNSCEVNSFERKFKNAAILFNKSLSDKYLNEYFVDNTGFFYVGAGLSALGVIAGAITEALSKGPGGPFMVVFLSIWLSIWTVVTYGLISAAWQSWKDLNKALPEERLQKRTDAISGTLFALVFLLFEIPAAVMFFLFTSLPLLLSVIVVVCVNRFFYRLIKAYTEKGRTVMDQLEGFRTYLNAGRSDFSENLDPLGRNTGVFEKYLPYAVALGCDRSWGERFEENVQNGRYIPAWYSDNSLSEIKISDLGSVLKNSVFPAVEVKRSGRG